MTTNSTDLKPINFWQSLLYFGLPGLAFFAAYHGLMPLLLDTGMNIWWAYWTQAMLPFIGLLAAIAIAYRREGRPWTRPALTERFRYRRVDGKTWLLMGVVFAVEVGLNALLARVDLFTVQQGWITVPDWLPDFVHPLRGAWGLEALDAATGGLQGNWGAPLSMLVLLFFNVIGEEFWWRGVILPRQEPVFGRWTWVVHGVLWNFFHFFKWWGLISLLPMSLGLSFVVSRSQNNTPGLIMHTVANGIGLISVVLAVLGR